MFFKEKKLDLNGKVGIVTGSGRGIGKAIALLMAKNKCNVVVCSRTEKEINEATSEINKFNVDCLGLKCDVSKLDDVKRLVSKTIDKFGKINFLVNNAGIGPYKSLNNTDYKDVNEIIDINLKGVIFFTKEALQYLDQDYGNRIINISSGIGKRGIANFTVYCATKFGVIGFTEALAGELRKAKTYAVCPVATDTKLYRTNFPNSRNIFIDSPEKVAKAVLRLCDVNCDVKSGSSVDV